MKILGLVTTLIATLALALPASAESFTSADVLEWDEEQQAGYFQTSVTMIGIVATQVDGSEHIANCIDAWFGGPVEGAEKRAARIREVMQGIPEYHPQAVILAVIEKECGKF